MIHLDENEWKYYENPEEAKSDGYTPVKCFSVLMFFTLAGRKTVMSKNNLIPIDNLLYLVLAKGEEKYYLREYRQAYSVDELFFYRPCLGFSGEDESVESLRRYVDDERVWLLYTQEMINDTNAMLQRLWKANLQGEGKIPYKMYIRILEAELKKEDYMDYGRALVGFRTCIKLQDENIQAMWKSCYSSKK